MASFKVNGIPAEPGALCLEPLEAAGKSESPSVSGSPSGVAVVHIDYGRFSGTRPSMPNLMAGCTRSGQAQFRF
ncbi:MAG: hypothetical protein P8Z37_17565, partial [Acidobacteriota bacterium]